MLAPGTKVKIIHDKGPGDWDKRFPGIERECNLGWKPTKGWTAVYRIVVHSFEMTYNGKHDLFYVVKLNENPSPSNLRLFREMFVHAVADFPEPGEEETVLPQRR